MHARPLCLRFTFKRNVKVNFSGILSKISKNLLSVFWLARKAVDSFNHYLRHIHACSSIYLSVVTDKLNSHWTDFREIFYCGHLPTIVLTFSFSLKSNKTNTFRDDLQII